MMNYEPANLTINSAKLSQNKDPRERRLDCAKLYNTLWKVSAAEERLPAHEHPTHLSTHNGRS